MNPLRRPNVRSAAPGILLLGLLLVPGPASGQAPVIRAGVARIDITPTSPVTLSGYGSRTDLSEGVHDPLSARVVAIEQNGHRLVLVSTDLIGFYGDDVLDSLRQAILDASPIEPAELFLTAIHTHSAPGLVLNEAEGHPNNVAYTRALAPKLASAVRESLADTAPVRLGIGSGASPVGVNRRQVVDDADGGSRIILGRNPEGATDSEVQVLTIHRADSEVPAAVLFAYATHSTALGPGNLRISGDVHGLAAQFIERHLGADALAPAFAGASGDIDPWFRVLPSFRTEQGWIPEPVLLGTMLGEEVVHVAETVEPIEPSGPIRSVASTLDLPRKVDPDEDSTSPPDATVPLNISVARVGDVAFVGLGAEVFNEIGRDIKAASPFPHTIVMTHCNGASGYLPTRSSYDAGGYEVQTSPFGPDAADLVTAEVRRLLESIEGP